MSEDPTVQTQMPPLQPQLQDSVQLLEYESKASSWLIPHRNSALENLPTEILVEIFMRMGWRDVLSSRQTCRRLLEISTARPLWVFLFNRLSAELMAPSILERSINAYTSEELEQIVLRRISSEIQWKSDQPPWTRSIPLEYDAKEDSSLLLEGGRWLLILTSGPRKHSSCVYAYDLDNFCSPKPKRIINLGGGKHKQIWLMAADVDRNESDLTFNICFVPSYIEEPAERPVGIPPGDIHIHRLTLNGCGNKATLKAHKIKTLRNSLGAGSTIVSLQGQYLARCVHSLKPCIEVFNWILSDSSVHLKS